jgi:hypothetical protein
MKRIDTRRQRRIIELGQNEASVDEIAAGLSVSKSTVERYLKKAGIAPLYSSSMTTQGKPQGGQVEGGTLKSVVKRNIPAEDVLNEPPDEMGALRVVLKNAGVVVRRESIVTAFSEANPDDLKQLDELLNEAAVPFAARRMVLRNWAIHRGTPMGYIDVKYPKAATIAKVEQEEEALEKKERTKALDPIDEMIDQMAQGKTAAPPGMPAPKDKEEPKFRILENGQTIEMTESKWTDYVIAQQRWKEQAALNASREEKKKEVEKIPFRLEDGTIIQVPADQVDKWLFMMKSTQPPEDKKDVFEMIREQEKTRQEMERFYQQQMSQLKDQNYQMLAERQEQSIRQLQANLQNRPNPIQEMVQTQEELKKAGLVTPPGGMGQDEHRFQLQEKTLDATMQLVVQQQQSFNRKGDQLIAALGPMMQNYALKAVANLPQPQELGQQLRQTRTSIAKEVLPIDQSAIERVAEQLESEGRPKARARRVVGVGGRTG